MTRSLARRSLSALALALTAPVFFHASAQSAQECTMHLPGSQTLEEFKAEVQMRAERGIYPVIGLKPDDVREALAHLASLSCDGWADVWMAVGDQYLQKARGEFAAEPAQADKDFVQAWRYYTFGRWPTLLSPGKQRAYAKATEAFLAHGRLLDPPLEVVRIPFEDGKEIVGYMRLPKRNVPVPLLLIIGGLDGWKDDMVGRVAALPAHGIGFIALDGPGTGEAPVKAGPGGDRMFTRVIDYAYGRPEIDKTRIAILGASFGGYWATRVAVTEKDRLAGAIDQSGPIDVSFQRGLPGSSRGGGYLFDAAPAVMSILDGVRSPEQVPEAFAGLSLKKLGYLGKPSAPMLVIGGAKDPIVAPEDLWLVLTSAETPKEAWINPRGIHMGREPGVWDDERLVKEVMLPWLVRTLRLKPD